MTATGPRDRVARRWGSVHAWSPPISSGTTPGLDDGRDRRLDRGVAAFRVARDDGDVAVVDARQDVERADVEVGVVRPEHHARRADGVGTEPPADAVGHPGVEGDADDREVDVLERPDVRQPGKGRRAREPRALQRVFGDVPRHAGECRRPARRRRRVRSRAPCPRPRRPSPTARPRPLGPRDEPAVEADPAGVPPGDHEQRTQDDQRRVLSEDPREHEVPVEEHAAEGGDPGQQPDQQPEAHGELTERHQRREQAGVRLDEVLEEPHVPARRALVRDGASDQPLDRRAVAEQPLAARDLAPARRDEDVRHVEADHEPQPGGGRAREQEPGPARLPELVRRHRWMDQAVQHGGLPRIVPSTSEC